MRACRHFLLTLAFLCAGVLPPLAGAEARQDDPRLDGLFARLKAAGSALEAEPVEREIWAVWVEAGDAGGDALMARGSEALARRDHLEARDAFDELVRRAPDFAEGWNKRATLHFVAGDYRASVEDIRRTLALEPRHFGALSGLGLIYLAVDRPEAAARSFEAALAIHPHLSGARAQVEMLKAKAAGEAL
jgi:tetratricopeptide (TPR) repeat protein